MPNKLLAELHVGQTFLRRLDKNYYLSELNANALRRKRKGYDESRKEEIRTLHWKRRMVNKGLPPRKWTKRDVDFLIKFYKIKEYTVLARIMGRSVGSIEHKVNRLRLRKNHQWNTN